MTPMIALRTAPTSCSPASIAANAPAENTAMPTMRHQELAAGRSTALNANAYTRFAREAPIPSHAAAVSGSVLFTLRSVPIRYPVYANDVQSASTMPIGSICASPPPRTTSALPASARKSARNSERGGALRSSAIVASITQTGYR